MIMRLLEKLMEAIEKEEEKDTENRFDKETENAVMLMQLMNM